MDSIWAGGLELRITANRAEVGAESVSAARNYAEWSTGLGRAKSGPPTYCHRVASKKRSGRQRLGSALRYQDHEHIRH